MRLPFAAPLALARLLSLGMPILAGLCLMVSPARADPLTDALAGTWTCTAKEGDSDVTMVLSYRYSTDFLVGEISESSGGALVDIWLRDGQNRFTLRRVISYDATIEMEVSEEAPTRLMTEGEMRHVLGSTSQVRETFFFTGSEDFDAVWEADSGDGWKTVLERSCTRL